MGTNFWGFVLSLLVIQPSIDVTDENFSSVVDIDGQGTQNIDEYIYFGQLVTQVIDKLVYPTHCNLNCVDMATDKFQKTKGLPESNGMQDSGL